MKPKFKLSITLLGTAIVVVLSCSSCKPGARSPKSNANQAAASESQQSPGPAGPSTEQDPPKAANKVIPALRGSYVLSEIEHGKGVVMVPPSFSTTITFMEDGSYSRMSKKGGTMDHSDNGNYHIEQSNDGRNLLVLKTIFSDSQMAKNTPEKKQTVTLSDDGEVLSLGATDGKVAIFRRSSQPLQPK